MECGRGGGVDVAKPRPPKACGFLHHLLGWPLPPREQGRAKLLGGKGWGAEGGLGTTSVKDAICNAR